jgi:hypothetical protein
MPCTTHSRKSGAAALGTMTAGRQAVMISGHVAAVRQHLHHESVANSARPGLPGIRARVHCTCGPCSPDRDASDSELLSVNYRTSADRCHELACSALVLYLSLIWLPLYRKASRDRNSEAWREYGVSERCYERSARLFRPSARRLSAGPRVHPRHGSPATLKHRSSFLSAVQQPRPSPHDGPELDALTKARSNGTPFLRGRRSCVFRLERSRAA